MEMVILQIAYEKESAIDLFRILLPLAIKLDNLGVKITILDPDKTEKG